MTTTPSHEETDGGERNGRRFSVLPARAVADAHLNDELLRILAILSIYTNREGFTFVSLRRLCDEMPTKISPATMSRRIAELVALGYVRTVERHDPATGARTTNLYQVVFDFPPPLSPAEVTVKGGLSTAEVPVKGPLSPAEVTVKSKDLIKDSFNGDGDSDEIQAVLERLRRGINHGISKVTSGWTSLAEWIIEQEKAGQSLDVWIAWYMSDPWRRDHAYHMTPQRIKDSWPLAFQEGGSQRDKYGASLAEYNITAPPDEAAPEEPQEQGGEAARVWRAALNAAGLSAAHHALRVALEACRAMALDGATLTVAAEDPELLEARVGDVIRRVLVGILNAPDASVRFIPQKGD